MRRGLWALALTAVIATASHAQMPRQFPANSKLGELIGQQQAFPLLQIDNKILRLAPGGLIIDEHNRTIVHGSLPQQAFVLYVADMNGDISRIVILRPDELERIKQAR